MSQWNDVRTGGVPADGAAGVVRAVGAMTLAPLSACRESVERGEWSEALELLATDAGAAGTPEGIELRALAAYGAGELESCLTAWEQLHACHVERGETAEAARAAAMLAMYLMMDTGLMAPVRGWLRRARRLVDGHDEVPAHALIEMVATYERLLCGDAAGVRVAAERAIELGERLGVLPAVVIGRVGAARARILAGDIDEGLAQLDEVGALLMTGQVDPLTTGMMYCELICVAQGMALHDRAHEWTEVMERWRPGAAFGGIHGRCRVHRAEMLRFSGPCDLAEEEALRACDELRPWMRREFGWPLVELGTIRLRRGDLDGAEEAFRAAHEHAWCPHPGLALVELERGRSELAAAMIAEAIAHPVEIPSKERPPFSDLCEAPLRESQVEIAAATGDVDTAIVAADRLAEIATGYPSRSLDAAATLAAARVALLEDRPDRAAALSTRAVAIWSELGAAWESSTARILLGEALDASGNAATARREWAIAATTLEAFGATRRAERAAILARSSSDGPAPGSHPGTLGPSAARTEPTTPPTGAAMAGFRLEAGLRVVDFGGSTRRLADMKGFRYIARLLEDPGREFHALDLVAVEAGTLPTATEPMSEAGLGVRHRGDEGLPALDDTAREAYRRRLAEVEEDLEDARSMNDPARAELAERDREYLVAELGRALGLAGRHRSLGGDAERARTSVTRSIRYAIRRLGEEHADLATHLDLCIHTGTYCAYRPDPLAPVVWSI